MSQIEISPPRAESGGSAAPAELVEAKRPVGRLYILDGLRFVAAMSVLAFHWTGIDGATKANWGSNPKHFMPTLFQFTTNGRLGVQLFFLISGFVICMSSWDRSPRQFVTARFTRLFPAYWCAVLVAFALWQLVPDGSRSVPTLTDSLTNLTMLETPLGAAPLAGAYWTLWVELCFYLLFLPLVRSGLTYAKVSVFAWVWLLSSLLIGSSVPVLSSFASHGSTPLFVGGLGMYLIYRFGPDVQSLTLVAASWVIMQNVLVKHVLANNKAGVYDGDPQVTWFVLAACYLVMLLVALHRFDRLNWRWLSTLGALSYPIYLLHEEMGWALIRNLRHHLGVYPTLAVTLVVVVGSAWLLHRFLEKPLAKRLRTLSLRIPLHH